MLVDREIIRTDFWLQGVEKNLEELHFANHASLISTDVIQYRFRAWADQ